MMKKLILIAIFIFCIVACKTSSEPYSKKVVIYNIVYTEFVDNDIEIYKINSDGSGRKNLTNNSAFDNDPIFSPNGKKIAFRSNRDGTMGI
jgi:Tol biopolymer transport system component